MMSAGMVAQAQLNSKAIRPALWMFALKDELDFSLRVLEKFRTLASAKRRLHYFGCQAPVSSLTSVYYRPCPPYCVGKL
jgi:hypothetical protein